MHEARTHDPVVVDACACSTRPSRPRAAPCLRFSRGPGDGAKSRSPWASVGIPFSRCAGTARCEPVFFARLERAVNDGHARGRARGGRRGHRPAVVGDPTPWMRGADGAAAAARPRAASDRRARRMNTSLARHVAERRSPRWGIDRAVGALRRRGEPERPPRAGGRRARRSSSRAARRARPRAPTSRRAASRRASSRATRRLRVERHDHASSCSTLRAPARAPLPSGSPASRVRARRLRLVRPADARTRPGAPGERYAPPSIATFEMFPQTSHVETVVALERRRPAKRRRREDARRRSASERGRAVLAPLRLRRLRPLRRRRAGAVLARLPGRAPAGAPSTRRGTSSSASPSSSPDPDAVPRTHPPTLITLARAALRDHPLVPRGSRVLVAVSGGPDSMALLHVLAVLRRRLGFGLFAHGVDHGLRAEAAAELDLAEGLARSLDVPFSRDPRRCSRRRQPPGSGPGRALGGLRAAASRAGADRIATGHHADDRAETLLMRLLRGTGVRGLAVLPPARVDGVTRIRPFSGRAAPTSTRPRRAPRTPFRHRPVEPRPRFLRVRVRHESCRCSNA